MIGRKLSVTLVKEGNEDAADDVEVSPLTHITEDGVNIIVPDWQETNKGMHASKSDGAMIQRNMSTLSGVDNDQEAGNLALYEEEGTTMPLLSAYLNTFIQPGPLEREKSAQHGRKKLGAVLGVYLPTLQHIFGVIMFLRLFWIVGIMGVGQAFGMIFLCCLTTFLTSISMSAIATNGVVESGGSYFMISRNLGPEFGSSVGILFYLANTVATAMYLIGSSEILLLFICPDLLIGGQEVRDDVGIFGSMTHNFRLYGTLLLLCVAFVVALGVRFVQIFAPVSLFCVIFSIISIYVGAVHKTIWPETGPYVCKLGNTLLQKQAFMPLDPSLDVCDYCAPANLSSFLATACANNNNTAAFCGPDFKGAMQCVQATPGFASSAMIDNFLPMYLKEDETTVGVLADKKTQVFQDLSTSFFVLLAIYFPSVTGIMTGSNMSGDLRDPQESIPKGTIAAQLTTSFVYLSFTLIFGGSFLGDVLRDKYGSSVGGGMVASKLVWPTNWILIIGSFTSTFGAGLQCLCSAPRLLQSIAKDNVIPVLAPFSVVTSRNEPIRGLILSTIIAEVAILIGSLDHIAPIVDFFFLMCYAFVNIVCALHSLLGAPNWRPRYRYYHWSLSLIGALLCFFIMFATHWHYAIISMALCLAIYKYVEYKGAKKEWGDGIRGLALTTAQYSLMKIEDKDPHPKNWRPQLLVFLKATSPDSEDTEDHDYGQNLLHFAAQLKAGRGLTMVTSLMPGDPMTRESSDQADHLKQKITDAMQIARVRGFCKAIVYDQGQFATTMSTLLQSAGIGGLRPNTVMVGWPRNWRTAVDAEDNTSDEYWDFVDKIHRGASLHMCLIVVKGLETYPSVLARLNGTIDVWWVLHDGGLLILLAFLLKQHKVWRGCRLRLFAVAQETDNSIKMKQDLERFMYQLRIDATVQVVEFSDTEISAYSYERTMAMEERSKFLAGLQLSLHEQQSLMYQIATAFIVKPRKAAMAKSKEGPKKQVSIRNQDEDAPKQRYPPTINQPHLLVESSRNAKKTDDNDNSEVASPRFGSSLTPDDARSADGVEDRPPTPGTPSDKQYQFTFTPSNKAALLSQAVDKQKVNRANKRKSTLPGSDVKKMHTAVRLNQQMLEHSNEAQLVVLNLPKPPGSRVGLGNYMEYMEVLTEGMDRVMMVRGTGQEVVTIYS